jgi:cytochrome b subunit of formate dehydrogenase
MVKEKSYKRFTIETRIQHITLFTTFILLVITGFCLTFSDTWWARSIVNSMGGWEMRGHIHHISGMIMVCIGIYHFFGYFLMKGRMKEMIPKFKDLEDFWDYIRYHLGAGEEPRYDRFYWKQKFDYWGAFWGIALMGITGLILMFPFIAMRYLPYAWYEIASLMHYYEAILASLAIFIWHFYNVHLNAEFPLQTSFLTGKIDEEQMLKEHPLEYERVYLNVEK